MKTFTFAVLAVSLAVLLARELRSNPSLPGALAQAVRHLVTAKLPPIALVPLTALIGLVLLWGLLAIAGPP